MHKIVCIVCYRFDFTHEDLDGCQLYFPKDPSDFLKKRSQSKFVPCNQTRADEFKDKYGKDNSNKTEIFTNRTLHLLKTAVDVFGALNVPFWLSGGNFLGNISIFIH